MNPWIPHLLRAGGGGGGPVLPPAGRTMLANLKSSLILEEGAGWPTWSRATKAWGFNELGYLEELASGCAFFGGARLVRNLTNTNSENFSNAAWVKSNCTVTGTNTIVCANATSAQRISQDSSGFSVTVGQTISCCYRVKKVSGGVNFVQIYCDSSRVGGTYANFSLNDGSFVVSGCVGSSTLVATDTYDIRASFLVIGSGGVAPYLTLINDISSGRAPTFTGDGVKSFELLRAWSVDVTGYDASYVPEYVSVGVLLNTVRTTSEDFSNAAWAKIACTVTGTNTIVCANATSVQYINQSGGGTSIAVGTRMAYSYRVKRVVGGVGFLQIVPTSTTYGSLQFVNISLVDGSYVATGCSATVTSVSADTFDVTIFPTVTVTGSDICSVAMINAITDARLPSFVGDGIKSFQLLRAWSVNVSQFDDSYVPPYYAVGVGTNVYFGAGIASAKYFETDWQRAPLPAASLLGFRRETSSINNLLYSRDLTQSAWTQTGVSGAEIITNGVFAADTDWAKTAGWSIGGGQTTCTANGSNQAISQASASAYVSGTKYVLSYTVVSNTLNAGTLRVGGYSGSSGFGTSPTTIPSTVGAQSIALTASPTGTGVTLDLWVNGAATGSLVIGNVSVKLAAIQCTRVTGLDGLANTATTLTATAADAIILQPISLASAARCASAYVKRRTGTGTISFTQDGGSTWTDITAQINGSTWSRVEITSTLADPSVGFKISTSGDEIDVDCVQNEAGAVATSPIVTTTAVITRNADSLTFQTASNWSDTEGTAYIEAQPLSWVAGGAIGSATNGLLLSAANSGATASDGTNTANGPAGSPSGREKLALRWGAGAMTVASGGVVGTPGTYDGGMGLASVGIAVNSSTYCGRVAIYNYAMTDAELQAITA